MWRRCAWMGWLWVPLACAASAVPDPKAALAEYHSAVARKDAQAVHALLSADARAAVSVEDVRQWLSSSGPELQKRAARWQAADSKVLTQAHVRYVDGESATLTYEPGGFRVDAAAALPAAARAPEDALGELRRALSSRNYPALLRVLTPESAQALDQQMAGLVKALEQPHTLPIQIEGTRATVVTSEGHRIELEQQDGVWRVRDFE